MKSTPLYWRTKFGPLCERQAGPDAEGWMTVRRLEDDATRVWNVRELHPVPDADAIAEALGELSAR